MMMTMRLYFTVCVLLFATSGLLAQDYNRITEVKVFKDGNQLRSAWTGGMNAPQFGEADFNNDGSKDIFVYDEDGEWVYVFIHIDDDEYVYDPTYTEDFPVIEEWLVMEDYNCDGVTDLFTLGHPATPKTYLGYYEDDRLKFTFDKDIIYYETSGGFSANLFSTSTHPPTMKDINGDGDKDWLAYDVSLLRILYYENQRVERGYSCDSLFFKRLDRCWGNIRETGISLDQTLGDTCLLRFDRVANEQDNLSARHPGGTAFALYDEDQNGVYDLILADATFSRLNYMRNNGTPMISNIESQNDSFPEYDQMVQIDIFPAPYLIDIDKDGDEDLLAAPFNAGAVDNYKNVWLYKNNGTNFQPFRFDRNDFLVGDMIDVGDLAYPSFFDYNNDGLEDLVIGNGGYYEGSGNYDYSLTLYENTGTAAFPKYTFVSRDFLLDGLELENVTPFFADLDGDGDKDFIAGEKGGKIIVLDNVNGSFTNSRFLKDVLGEDIDVGQYSDPELYDFNGDGRLDLIIGTRNGNLVYYENSGSISNPSYSFKSENFGNAVAHPANSLLKFSSPLLGDFDNDSNVDLLLSGADRRVKFFSDIGVDHTVEFEETSENFFNADFYTFIPGDIFPRLSLAAADLSQDGKPEIVLGTNTGGLLLFSEELIDTVVTTGTTVNLNDLVEVFPNPASSRIYIQWGTAFGNGGSVELLLTDVVGRRISIEQISNTGNTIVDIQDLAPGYYHATLRKGNRLGTVRFIKYQ